MLGEGTAGTGRVSPIPCPPRALSVKRPWRWAFNLPESVAKRVENRPHGTDYRGPVALHCSDGLTYAEWRKAKLFVDQVRKRLDVPPLPAMEELPPGGVIFAVARIAGVWTYSSDPTVSGSFGPWGIGPVYIELADYIPVAPVPAKGALGLWHVARCLACGVIGPRRKRCRCGACEWADPPGLGRMG